MDITFSSRWRRRINIFSKLLAFCGFVFSYANHTGHWKCCWTDRLRHHHPMRWFTERQTMDYNCRSLFCQLSCGINLRYSSKTLKIILVIVKYTYSALITQAGQYILDLVDYFGGGFIIYSNYHSIINIIAWKKSFSNLDFHFLHSYGYLPNNIDLLDLW